MFESFHTQLKIIERDSTCNCGACKTASHLTLKSIAHHGVVQEIKVMQFDLDRRTRWLSAVERVDRPATTERIGMRSFYGLTVEWVSVKSDIGGDEITYVEEGRIVDKDLPARASFILKRLGERRTSLQFRMKWLCSPGAAARNERRDPRGSQARPREY